MPGSRLRELQLASAHHKMSLTHLPSKHKLHNLIKGYMVHYLGHVEGRWKVKHELHNFRGPYCFGSAFFRYQLAHLAAQLLPRSGLIMQRLSGPPTVALGGSCIGSEKSQQLAIWELLKITPHRGLRTYKGPRIPV